MPKKVCTTKEGLGDMVRSKLRHPDFIGVIKLSRQIGFTAQYISFFKSGEKKEMPLENLMRFANGLNIRYRFESKQGG